eukprot:2700675-Rhodomonas_salina.1
MCIRDSPHPLPLPLLPPLPPLSLPDCPSAWARQAPADMYDCAGSTAYLMKVATWGFYAMVFVTEVPHSPALAHVCTHTPAHTCTHLRTHLHTPAQVHACAGIHAHVQRQE